jgi:hypothetical protein
MSIIVHRKCAQVPDLLLFVDDARKPVSNRERTRPLPFRMKPMIITGGKKIIARNRNLRCARVEFHRAVSSDVSEPIREGTDENGFDLRS